jgi:hypothetical protein
LDGVVVEVREVLDTLALSAFWSLDCGMLSGGLNYLKEGGF